MSLETVTEFPAKGKRFGTEVDAVIEHLETGNALCQEVISEQAKKIDDLRSELSRAERKNERHILSIQQLAAERCLLEEKNEAQAVRLYEHDLKDGSGQPVLLTVFRDFQELEADIVVDEEGNTRRICFPDLLDDDPYALADEVISFLRLGRVPEDAYTRKDDGE